VYAKTQSSQSLVELKIQCLKEKAIGQLCECVIVILEYGNGQGSKPKMSSRLYIGMPWAFHPKHPQTSFGAD